MVGRSVAENSFFMFSFQLHVAEHPAGHLVLKWLIEQDEKMKKSGREGRL